MKSIIFLIAICLASMLIAQDVKNEKESRLKNETIRNEMAGILSDYLIDARKMKFYQETDGVHKSFEAKFELNKTAYSIEFSESLQLEDIEIIVDQEDLDETIFMKIEAHFNQYEKFKITKIQKQFTSERWSMDEAIEKGITEGIGEIVRYEIEAMVKSQGRWQAFEVLFSAEGEFIQEREIIKRSADHILY